MLGVSLFEVADQSDYMQWWQYSRYITDYGVYVATSENEELETGDRIIAMDDVEVSTISELKALLSEKSVGDTVTLTISRLNGRKSEHLHIDIVLRERTQEDN